MKKKKTNVISTYRKSHPGVNKRNILYKKFDLFLDINKNVFKNLKQPDTLIHLAWDFLLIMIILII